MLDQCVAYFKGNKAYKRLFEALRKKWKEYGKAAGYIVLKDATEAERDALKKVMGKHYHEVDIKLKVSDFEQALHETAFQSISLKELLSAYFSESMETNKKVRLEKAEKKSSFFENLHALVLSKPTQQEAAKWISAVAADKKYGYYLIALEYEKSEKNIRDILLHVCAALARLNTLRNQRIRLAVLGAEITSNPHFFDRGTIAGRLLLSALGFAGSVPDPQNAEEMMELYYASGITPDDISSFTTLYGIRLFTEQGTHRAYEAFIKERESYVVTLSNLNRIVKADCSTKQVFIFENQMVFSHLCESAKDLPVSMMCTSGQMKTASLLLIDLLCDSGCTLHYSGDIDPEGIGIADRILARHPAQIIPWRWTKEDYRLSISEEIIDEQRMKKLDKVTDPRFLDVIEDLRIEKRAGYQELLLEQMLGDIRLYLHGK